MDKPASTNHSMPTNATELSTRQRTTSPYRTMYTTYNKPHHCVAWTSRCKLKLYWYPSPPPPPPPQPPPSHIQQALSLRLTPLAHPHCLSPSESPLPPCNLACACEHIADMPTAGTNAISGPNNAPRHTQAYPVIRGARLVAKEAQPVLCHHCNPSMAIQRRHRARHC